MAKRLYNNTEIQETIANIVCDFSQTDLDKYCRQDYCKIVFDINYALLLKVPEQFTEDQKADAVKDEGGYNRWTWKYQFNKNGFAYAISTQWYERNDEYVQKWLRRIS